MSTLQRSFIAASLTFILGGCSQFSSQPPPISDEGQIFENEYFKISYPKGWKVHSFSKEEIDSETNDFVGGSIVGEPINAEFSFYDPTYPKYDIPVEWVSTTPPADSLLSASFENESRKEGFLNTSIKTDQIIVNGMNGKRFTCKAKNEAGQTEEVVQIFFRYHDSTYFIGYHFYDNYTEKTRERFRTIVNSFQAK